MKEQSKKRKLELKRLKEKRLHRQKLKSDIAQFMVDFFMDNIECHTTELEKMLMKGVTGFGSLRNAKLVKEFENLHVRLMAKKQPSVILCEWTDYPRKRRVLEGKDYENRLAAYVIEADSLMLRLIEVSFDLDFEE